MISSVIITKLIKATLKFIKKQLLVSVFIGLILFVGLIALIKLPFRKTAIVYTTVKLNQGVWWSNTQKPGIWFLEALKKGDKEYNLLGQPLAEIVGVRYYQQMNLDLNQFDIYLTVKLNAEKNGNQEYVFKRTAIAVGSPLDLNFKNSQVVGTVIRLQEKKEDEHYIEKTITLTKKFAFPWESEGIKVGDIYFDGEKNILEITSKQIVNTTIIAADIYGNFLPENLEAREYITLKARIKLKKNSFNQLVYGEEQVIKIGSYANLVTNNTMLTDYIVAGLD
jgi:hypothetical protein